MGEGGTGEQGDETKWSLNCHGFSRALVLGDFVRRFGLCERSRGQTIRRQKLITSESELTVGLGLVEPHGLLLCSRKSTPAWRPMAGSAYV